MREYFLRRSVSHIFYVACRSCCIKHTQTVHSLHVVIDTRNFSRKFRLITQVVNRVTYFFYIPLLQRCYSLNLSSS